jgi:hypothetical protein
MTILDLNQIFGLAKVSAIKSLVIIRLKSFLEKFLFLQNFNG